MVTCTSIFCLSVCLFVCPSVREQVRVPVLDMRHREDGRADAASGGGQDAQ